MSNLITRIFLQPSQVSIYLDDGSKIPGVKRVDGSIITDREHLIGTLYWHLMTSEYLDLSEIHRKIKGRAIVKSIQEKLKYTEIKFSCSGAVYYNNLEVDRQVVLDCLVDRQ